MSELLRQILSWASLFLGSAMGGALVGGLISGIAKGKMEKIINKNNIKEISKETVDATVGQIKKISFNQSIQPVVESELEKINEKVDVKLRKQIYKLESQNEKIINILEKFIAYFDYSIGIPEKVKEEAKTAIQTAKGIEEVIEDKQFEVEVIDEPKVEVVEDKPKAKNNVVR